MVMLLADLRIRFPQVASTVTYPDVYLQALLDEAASQITVGPCQWRDDLAILASGYLAMHLLAMAPAASGVGMGVASVSAGQASISYWAPPGGASALELTPYGHEYLRLMRLNGPAMRLVDDCIC